MRNRIRALAPVVLLLSVALVVAPERTAASPTTDRLAALEARVLVLEQKVAQLMGSPSPSPTRTPSPTPTPTPVPTPPPTPSPSPSPESVWTLVFEDHFQRTVAEGHFLDGGNPRTSNLTYLTADGRYGVYKSTWLDTSKNGHYDPSIISIGNGMMNIALQTRDGHPRVAAMSIFPPGGDPNRGGMLGYRYEVRLRADRMIGYKGVPMLWADAATTNDLLLQYGENDWPESDFDKQPKAFMHRTNATSFNDQDVYFSPAGYTWQDWHTYQLEWIPGKSVEFFADGVSIGKSTSRIPTVPMHMNLQFETWTNGILPDPSVKGNVQIDVLRVWAYTP